MHARVVRCTIELSAHSLRQRCSSAVPYVGAATHGGGWRPTRPSRSFVRSYPSSTRPPGLQRELLLRLPHAAILILPLLAFALAAVPLLLAFPRLAISCRARLLRVVQLRLRRTLVLAFAFAFATVR